MDFTILYYTSNREDEYFENKIMETILKNKGDIPVVSVSQKPINLGKNICVGMHDSNYMNEYRQIQIGLREIKTPYVLTAEADCLYPPEYFQFVPTELGHCYRYNNVWVHCKKENSPLFYFKGNSNGSQMIDREMWLELIDRVLGKESNWATGKRNHLGNELRLKTDGRYIWISENPVVTFKTGDGVRNATPIKKGTSPKDNLPYWGSAKDLREQMFNSI